MSYTLTPKYSYSIPCSSNTSGTVSSIGAFGSVSGTRAGSKVDGWREKVSKGETASSAYSLDAYTFQLGASLSERVGLNRDGGQSEQMWSAFSGYPGVAWAIPATVHLVASAEIARSMALSKLYTKLESERSQLNSLSVLAEFGDVLRQFGRPFGSIVEAFHRHDNRLLYERRRLKGSETWKREKFLRIAAETWLEVSFGLIPSFSDATDVAKAFGKLRFEVEESPDLRDRMFTTADQVAQSTGGPYTATGQPFSYIVYNVWKEKVTVARAKYTIGLQGDIRADFGSNNRLLELLGIEPRNLPLAAWEFTPWSWLVDYVTNVQQILQAGATLTTRVKWIVLSQTTQTIETFKNQLAWTGSGSFRQVSFSSNRKKASGFRGYTSPQERVHAAVKGRLPLDTGDFRIIRTTFNRTIPATLGVPPFYLKSPLGDLKKIANLAAVVIARSKNRTTWLD